MSQFLPKALRSSISSFTEQQADCSAPENSHQNISQVPNSPWCSAGVLLLPHLDPFLALGEEAFQCVNVTMLYHLRQSVGYQIGSQLLGVLLFLVSIPDWLLHLVPHSICSGQAGKPDISVWFYNAHTFLFCPQHQLYVSVHVNCLSLSSHLGTEISLSLWCLLESMVGHLLCFIKYWSPQGLWVTVAHVSCLWGLLREHGCRKWLTHWLRATLTGLWSLWGVGGQQEGEC